MAALLETVRIVWTFACSATVLALLALVFRNQLLAIWHRLWQTSRFPARHRLHIEESPVAVTPAPVIHPHDDLSEPVRRMLARQKAPDAAGRGRHWVSDALHGETGKYEQVAIAAMPAEVEPELVGAVA